MNYLAIIFLVMSFASFANPSLWQWQLWQLPNHASLRGSAAYNNTLWVSGSKNTVYISTDNGKNWRNISPQLTKQYDFRDIEVLSDNTAIVMAAGSDQQSALFITHNQGSSWQLLYQNTDKQGFFDSIAFWDENNGVLLGDPVNGAYVVEITHDQGKSWHRVNKQNLPPLLANEAAFAASGNTIIVGEKNTLYFTTGGLSAHVYQSLNNGNSWQQFSVPLHTSTKTSGGYALAFNKQKQLFVLGGDYLQRNGTYSNMATFTENTWQKVDTKKWGLRTAMACTSDVCIATGKLSSDISFDHGHTWQPFQQQGFYTLASTNTAMVAAGDDGKVAVLITKKQ